MGKKELIDMSLDGLLSGGKYLLPHRYFKNKRVHNLSELTNESIIIFCESEGAGVKKVKDFLELLTNVYIENILKYDFNYSIMDADFWFAPVEFKRFREYLKEVNISYVDEIDGEITEILSDIRGINKKKVVQILERLEEFNCIKRDFKDLLILEPKEISQNTIQEPQKILQSLVNIHNKERVRDVLYKRYAQGETLENIGDEYSLSRERIRQLQLIGTEEVNDYLKARKFKKSLKEYFKDREYCTYKEFYSLFSEENAHYAKVMIYNYDGFYLFGELELIYFEDNKNVLEMVGDIIKRLPSEFFLYDFLDYLIIALDEIGLKDISLSGIEHLITLSHYNIYGEYATKLKLNTADILELIFKHYHKGQLKFNEDGFKYVKKIARKHLNYELDGNIRAFENRLRENPSMLLVDKLTFQHIENAKVSEDVIIFIGEALEEIFSRENIVNATQVFEENKEYLISKGISTKYKMYNLISIYFGDYYKVGRGNTLEIYKSDNVIIQNKEALLIDYINKTGGITFKGNIINDMSWPSYKIEDTISKSSNLVKLGEQITTIDNLEITEEERTTIREILDRLLGEGGYTTGLLVYDKVVKNYKLRGFVKRANINRSEKIASIAKKLFRDIRGHINFIFNDNSPYKNIEEAICGEITGTIQRESLKEHMWSLGYKDMMTSMTINRIIENGSFYELSREELVSSKSFKITLQVYESIKIFIEEKMGNEEYLVISNIEDFSELPVIKYNWTPHLLKSLACKCGFKSIDRIYNDIRGEKIILSRENGNIQSFEQLLLHLLNTRYNGVMQEGKIYDFFAKLGIVKAHKDIMDKKIPYDLKVTGKIKIDEVGLVNILN